MMKKETTQIARLLEAEYARVTHVEKIYSNDISVRCAALRAFYRMAGAEIQEAGCAEWGIDPYEVDWMRVFTPIERALWHDIRCAGAVLYPQYPVGRFFVDFGNPVAKVAVECDGSAFHLDIEKDHRREAEIRALGWGVYRLSGRECKQDFDEETMTKSAPRLLIDRLVNEYGIGRK